MTKDFIKKSNKNMKKIKSVLKPKDLTIMFKLEKNSFFFI